MTTRLFLWKLFWDESKLISFNKQRVLILLFSITTALCYSVALSEIPPKRYPIPYKNETLLLPYESSHDPFAKNESVKRVLFVIHSASYDARQYYSNGLSMLDKAPQEKDRTMIIAPHFLDTDHMQEISKPDFLYWTVAPFRGSSRGYYINKDIQISAFEVADTILTNLIKTKIFPNLKEVVVMGHSAGGQMVNRYAACNLFESRVASPNNIKVKYVVMAPSSYVYFSNERPLKGSMTRFAVPENPDAGYNNWGYGMDNLYSYHQRNHIKADWITQNYPQKNVLYLVGSDDTNGDDPSLAKGPGAMLQGPNRLVRARLYYNYLRHLYGDEIKGHQYFRIVKNMGHWGKGLMTSPACIKFVFDYQSKGKL